MPGTATMTDAPRLGFLYPDSSGEDDLARFSERLTPSASAVIAHTVAEDANRVDALLETGAPHRLAAGASELATRDVRVALWACTSGSFVFGLDGARAQAARVADQLGVPASSTSLAFVDALEAVGARSVAIASVYPRELTDRFVIFLEAAGVAVAAATSGGVASGRETEVMDLEDTLALVGQLDLDGADAVLLPCTALRTADTLATLESLLPCIVLTANQVTVWEAARLAGLAGPQPALGALGRA